MTIAEGTDTKSARKDERQRKLAVFVMLLFASALSLAWGLVVTHGAHGIILDFQMADIGARCLMRGCDVYNQVEMTHFYLGNGGPRVSSPQGGGSPHYAAAIQVYPPTAELFFAAFAIFPSRVAYALWIALIALLMPIAAFLMWDSAYLYAPDLPFYLAWFLLVNSGGLQAGGNPAGIAVSLCVVSVWCVLQDRYVTIGILCMAISLSIKPHDAGLIWLYLLLLGAAYAKRAIQALLPVSLLIVVSVTWIWHVSPHWLSELESNLSVNSSNDPAGPAAIAMINLQTVFAFFSNNPRFYNLATYAVCLPLILLCIFITLRGDRTRKGIWLGIATITVLSLLPLYHRPYDAKLLLLTIPACAIMWSEGGVTRWMALLFTGAGIVATSEIPLIFLQIVTVPQGPGLKDRALAFFTTRSAPLVLLAEGVFYLWAHFQHNSNQRVLDSRSHVPDLAESLPS